MPNAQLTPGPILHFVSFRNTTQGYFLGTSVTAPKTRIEKYEIPVLNDLGGRSARFQSIQDGYEGKVFTTLNRFDYKLLQTIRALGNGTAPVVTGPTPLSSLGSESGVSRGTLVIGVSDFQLILVNSYAGTTAAGQPTAVAVADMNSARGWYSCSCMAYEESTEGTRVLEVTMGIECRNVFNPSPTDLTARGFSLYTEVPVIPLNAFS